ncbi:MAG TPA: hypothetical protein VNU75_05975, partial [Acidimicrobiales bacterium]|nr:hypothetical protein [Acidimicrobiales bacterium]
MRTRALTVATFATVAAVAVVVLPALPATAKGLSNSQIQQLENKLSQGKKLTYSATYVSSDGSS